jgi:hypothetical protein
LPVRGAGCILAREAPKMTLRPSLAVVIPLIVAFIGAGYWLGGPLPAMIFAFASTGGLVLWLFTTYRVPIDPNRVIIPYLLTVIFFIGHVYEEYVAEFDVALSHLTGWAVTQHNLLSFAGFFAPAMWLTGAILLLKRWVVGYYFLCFFFVAMMLAELSHFIFPLMEDGTFHYFPGMWTAALPLLPAAWGLVVMLREVRKHRAHSQPDGD